MKRLFFTLLILAACAAAQTNTRVNNITTTGQVLAANGIAATPSISMVNDTSSGFYNIGVGNWGWSSAGTGKWQFLGGSFTGVAGTSIGWNSSTINTLIDTNISRAAAGIIDVGTGSAGNAAGEIDARTHGITGSTSGKTSLVTDATASGTVTLKSGTYNILGDSLTQTLTAKTLTSPAFTGTETGMSITSPAMTSPTFNTGISQGSGHKHQRFGTTCTTGTTAGAQCTTSYTWTSAFADANYTLSITCISVATQAPSISAEAITASGFTVRVEAPAAAGAGTSCGGINAFADHD